MSVKHNLEQWISELDSDGMCDISDKQVIDLIRGYAQMEEKCAALAAELESAEKRIAELDAREVVIPDYTEIYKGPFAIEVEHQVKKVLSAAGIITKVGE